MEYWILLIIEFIAGFGYYLFNEFEDRSVRSKWESNKQFLNIDLSWKNKWAWYYGTLIPYKKCWYHFGVHPKHKERFPYSSTILVGLTDGEHLFQLLKNLFILLAIGIMRWQFMIVFLFGRLIMSFIKERFLTWIS